MCNGNEKKCRADLPHSTNIPFLTACPVPSNVRKVINVRKAPFEWGWSLNKLVAGHER